MILQVNIAVLGKYVLPDVGESVTSYFERHCDVDTGGGAQTHQ